MMTATMGAGMTTFLPAACALAALAATFLKCSTPHVFRGSGHKTTYSSK